MMLKQERALLKITFIVSLVGMLLLIFISQRIAPQNMEAKPINSVKDEEENSQATVTGAIESVKEMPTLLILKVKDKTGSIKVIADKKQMTMKLKKGMKIEVTGIFKMYKNEQELEARTIKVFE